MSNPQILKYTADNIQYTALYLHTIQQLDWWRLKFADEVHFEGRGTCRSAYTARGAAETDYCCCAASHTDA